jgi:hypothetical protein
MERVLSFKETVMSQPGTMESPSSSAGTGGSSLTGACGALALLAATVGVVGSLYLSVGMDLRACPLCFYQRSFVMGVFAVLVLGILADRARLGLLLLVSSALSVAGMGVASFHVYLVVNGTLECPSGVFGLGDAPTQSLAMFAPLTAVTLVGAFAGRRELKTGAAGVLLAMALGGALAYGCVSSSPPLPAATPPDGKPLLTCRPVWKGELPK